MIGNVMVAKDGVTLSNLINMRRYYRPQDTIKIVVVDDVVVNQPNYVGGSILLPPPSALFQLVDYDDIQGFQQRYYEYLKSPEVAEYIATIIYVILDGINVILYSNNTDTMVNDIERCLQNILANEYGIITYPSDPNLIFHAGIDVNRIPYLLNEFLPYYGFDTNSLKTKYAPPEESVFKFGGR